MKKHRIRNCTIIIICIPLVLIVLSYSKYKLNNIEDSCSSEVERYLKDIRNQDGSIFLNEYLEFKCDGFYIIGPYITSKHKRGIVGETWHNYSSYVSYLFNEVLFHGDTTDEIYQQLVFIKDEKVVSLATTHRKDGDFTLLKQNYYNIHQLFTNVRRDDKWFYIVEGMKN